MKNIKKFKVYKRILSRLWGRSEKIMTYYVHNELSNKIKGELDTSIWGEIWLSKIWLRVYRWKI